MGVGVGGGVTVGTRWSRCGCGPRRHHRRSRRVRPEGVKQGHDVTFSNSRFQWGPEGRGLQGERRGGGGWRGPGKG